MIVIVDYGMGNLASIANMLRKASVPSLVTSDPTVVREATKLILPGVGAFESGMKNLRERKLVEALDSAVLGRGVPVIGLCLGMQLMTRRSEEGTTEGLSWIDAETVRFRLDGAESDLKIPHMGWNSVAPASTEGLFEGLEQPRFYFVHSYHVACDNASDVLARTNYGYDFASAIRRNNIMGVQFHPEKSHRYGMQLLKNFAKGIFSGVAVEAATA